MGGTRWATQLPTLGFEVTKGTRKSMGDNARGPWEECDPLTKGWTSRIILCDRVNTWNGLLCPRGTRAHVFFAATCVPTLYGFCSMLMNFIHFKFLANSSLTLHTVSRLEYSELSKILQNSKYFVISEKRFSKIGQLDGKSVNF